MIAKITPRNSDVFDCPVIENVLKRREQDDRLLTIAHDPEDMALQENRRDADGLRVARQ